MIVPRILGWMPGVEPRVAHQRGGELKVSDEAVFGYQRYLGQQCIPSLKGDQIVNPTNSNLDSTSSPPPNRHSPSKPNLAKFVGHLWRGALAKSFAAAVCSEPAHVVWVKMYQGGGRRGFNDQGWGEAVLVAMEEEAQGVEEGGEDPTSRTGQFLKMVMV